MVTSRNSGTSYRNRVEIQNGCLALGHANLFIPSTLNGSCLDNSGGINREVLENNLNSAIDVYISRVDGAPCASTSIHLYKGPKSDIYRRETELFKKFSKGSKEVKEQLRKCDAELYAKFERVWKVRDMHLVKTYPLKYIFLLRCCYKNDCTHPVCAKGKSSEVRTWYPNGPPLSYIPIPTPDPNRPYGRDDCSDCKGKCSGHYMKPSQLWEHVSRRGNVAEAMPPSEVIRMTYQQYKDIPPKDIVEKTAEKVLLPLEEVEMWFEHVKTTAENCARGAKRAAETRRANAQRNKQSSSKGDKRKSKNKCNKTRKEARIDVLEASCNEECTCKDCGMFEPPDSYVDESGEITWIQCNGCESWFHMDCLGLSGEVDASDTWICYNCNEQW